ncbi:centrosomal protein of 57 kDa isoform X1 [Parasteatoda tepidariorum]|uniref:centrosomal protein of 57 kDa isoform X1 n=1 Tax=Parasteatoda tepidariorum TaxID=114398 RepID=UPI001C7204F8|nr:centrosomal protein of 57 kDa isoform X1 [Parasteatoda tepidariorum]
MDFNNGLYVFNGVPGLETSKGERIVKALQKLETKIKRLKQVRNSEREMSSKSGSTDTEDITLSDVRLKLLSLQLQYVRLKFRSTRDDEAEHTVSEIEHQYELSDTDYTEIQNCCKETQTGMSLHEIMPTKFSKSATSHTEETCTYSASEPTVPAKEVSTSNFDAISSHNQLLSENASNCDAINNPSQLPSESARNVDAINSQDQLPSESVPPSSRDIPLHYHLNINDVPFILGGSAFESHNLIANIQNLLAKMKSHNKALCGPRHQVSQNCANSLAEKGYTRETKSSQERMMKDISKDLTEIHIKQAKLIERFDSQISGHLNGNQAKDTPHFEKEVNPKQTKVPSNTGSTLTGATIAVRSKQNKQLKSTKVIKKNKHVVPTNKIRMNLPQVARQRLLRSIREAKTHLSEEDISWV